MRNYKNTESDFSLGAVILISEGYSAARTKLKHNSGKRYNRIVCKTEILTNICAEKEKGASLIMTNARHFTAA